MLRLTKQILEIENQFSIFLMENNMGKISKLRGPTTLPFFRFWRHVYLDACKKIHFLILWELAAVWGSNIFWGSYWSPQASFELYYHRKRIIVAVYRSPKPYKILSDCYFNTRKIRNARLILNRTNQSIFCTSAAPISVSSALFCTAAIPNVTDIALHILCASRRTCSTIENESS